MVLLHLRERSGVIVVGIIRDSQILIIANIVYQLHSLSHSRPTSEDLVEEPGFTLPYIKLITQWISTWRNEGTSIRSIFDSGRRYLKLKCRYILYYTCLFVAQISHSVSMVNDQSSSKCLICSW